jgi:hypothetical protein
MEILRPNFEVAPYPAHGGAAHNKVINQNVFLSVGGRVNALIAAVETMSVAPRRDSRCRY